MNLTDTRDARSRFFSFVSKGGLCRLVLLAAWAALLPSTAPAQLFPEHGAVYGDPNTDENFGMYVAASDNTIVVGTASNRHAYVFTRGLDRWELQQKFTNSGGDVMSASDVAVDGDTLVARGTIYVRTGSTWTAQQTLLYEFPTTALQGDTLVVGSSHNRVSNRGNVTVYFRSGGVWNQQLSFGPDGSEQFLGDHVALDGDTLVASVESAAGAYVYVRSGSTWTRQARLPLPEGTGWGMHVALEGDTAAVSNPSHDVIYIFTRTGTTWTLASTLPMPAGGGDLFGYGLSLKGGMLAARADSKVHVFARTVSGWVLAETFTGADYRFEYGVTLGKRGKFIVIGNPLDDTSGTNSGKAEVHGVPQLRPPGSGWQDFDIGPVNVPGGSNDGGAQVQVRGSGADIWERADQFHYRAETMTGNGAIIARVDSISGSGHPWAKAGLMLREDVAPASRNVMALVAAGGPVGLQVRESTFETTGFKDAPWLGAPLWLMLARSGDLFAAYRSNDGDNWTPIGSATVVMPATIHVGLAVTSHDNAVLATAAFSSVELVSSQPPIPPPNPPSNLTGGVFGGTTVQLQWTDNSTDETNFAIERSLGTGGGNFERVGLVSGNTTTFADTGLGGNTTYSYRVRALRNTSVSAPSNTFTVTTTNPPPATLTGADLGSPGVPGSFSQSGGGLTVDAAGADIWNQSDEGYFVNREITGDFDLRAKVTSLATNSHPWAKAGVMVRESLDPRSRNLFTMVSASAAAGLQVRGNYGLATSFVEGRWVTAPYWVRLTRTGSNFQSFISEDGANWQLVQSWTLAFNSTVRAGVAVSSHNHGFPVRATFTNLSFGP